MLIRLRGALSLACSTLIALSAEQPTHPDLTSTNSAVAETALAPANDPVELEYQQLLEKDDEALQEVDRWIREEQAQRASGVGLSDVTLKARILDRFRPVRQAYDEFLQKHPRHARAQLAYGSFLAEIGEEDLAVEHMEKSKELDPNNPAAWNNLANHYGHRGPVKKAFEYFAKAIELNPNEPVYYHNLADSVFLYRKDAGEYYSLDEGAVFEKALSLYREAMKLAPHDFVLASDYASSFYGMLPMGSMDAATRKERTSRITARAIAAWKEVLPIASDELQRQGVLIHLARNRYLAGLYEEARTDLQSVTNAVYEQHKSRILRNIESKENPPAETANETSAAQVP